MNRQCEIGAMRKLTPEEAEEREWASPAFGVPKKNGEIRLVIDFRYLNHCLIRREYPLPTIEEMFSEIRGFEFASVVDLSMGYLSLRVLQRDKQATHHRNNRRTLRMPRPCHGTESIYGYLSGQNVPHFRSNASCEAPKAIPG